MLNSIRHLSKISTLNLKLLNETSLNSIFKFSNRQFCNILLLNQKFNDQTYDLKVNNNKLFYQIDFKTYSAKKNKGRDLFYYFKINFIFACVF